MGGSLPGLERAYVFLFVGALVFLAIMVILCLIRAIIGPRIADRVVAVNMMVIILTKVYMGVYTEWKRHRKNHREEG